ncbi:transmembrane protein, putative [Medicago truncatula]|uniref:Transmembrane protein, putative n=1 Tax=Medicago truncatula TaxID=3880 RepID=A0A072VUG7_MEDTR|nr:transmembrane protein, putative [Medicago truncatula]
MSTFGQYNQVPCFGFGEASAHDQGVFALYSKDMFCNDFLRIGEDVFLPLLIGSMLIIAVGLMVFLALHEMLQLAFDHVDTISLMNSNFHILVVAIDPTTERSYKLRRPEGLDVQKGSVLSKKKFNVKKVFEDGEIVSGRGLNQERNMKGVAHTRWSSHFGALVNLILMYSSVIDVLNMLKDDVTVKDGRGEENGLLLLMNNFDFAITLHLMKKVLGISNNLSQTLQIKNQDIVNAMNLVNITKELLQTLRDDE